MKKLSLLFVLFAILFIAQKGSAQPYTPIGQRSYLGVQAGLNYGWQAGSENFVVEVIYPYHQNAISTPLPLAFSSLGSGLGFSLGASIDLNLSEKWNVNGTLHYSAQKTKSVESTTVDFTQSHPNYKDVFFDFPKGIAVFENTITQSFNAVGADILVRYQIMPETWYAFAGLEINSILGNKTSFTQSILSSTSAPSTQYKDFEGALQHGTVITMPEREVKDLYKSLWLGPKLGVGTFFPIGNDGWVLAPELSVAIPLTNLYNSEYTITEDQDPKRKLVTPYPSSGKFSAYNSTTPKLWFVGLSVALKFPLGNYSAETKSDDIKRGKE